MQKWNIEGVDTKKWVSDTQEMLRQRGIKRFTHQLFALSGTLSFKHGKTCPHCAEKPDIL